MRARRTVGYKKLRGAARRGVQLSAARRRITWLFEQGAGFLHSASTL